MPTASVFVSKQAYRQAFIEGLDRLLTADDLGAYILVCANASFDPAIYRDFAPRLRERFLHLAADFEALDSAPDDQTVFAALREIGFDTLVPTQRRNTGPWELQYNQLRSFRPSRNSAAAIATLKVDFNPGAFNFNKPFLRRETFWQGELLGRRVDLLYNKFPFADLHGLLVPERENGLPQFLQQRDHDYVWALTTDLGRTLPGVGFGYNAFGAYASVNHLHFQMFVRDAALPVARDIWRHNGGSQPYPTACETFDSPDQAWHFIQSLHDRGITYNLLYRPGRLYCLPRRRQGDYHHAPWTSGYSWYEMSGGVITSDANGFSALHSGHIEAEFAKLAVTAD